MTISTPPKKRMAKKKARKSFKSTKRMVRYNRNNVTLGKGFPKKMEMTHTYVDNYAATSTTGVLLARSWRANGMFDPDQSGVGHQPMYFDQMSALYNHYVVIGSKIEVTFLPVANYVPIVVGVFINDDSVVTPGNYQSLGEVTSSTQRFIPFSNSRPIKIVKKWSAKKTFGGSILANTSLLGTPTSDPTEQSLFTYYLQAADFAATVSLQVIVKISYIAVWKELKDIAGS